MIRPRWADSDSGALDVRFEAGFVGMPYLSFLRARITCRLGLVSRAFIKEDSGDEIPPERRQPSGPNYVTPRGLDLLREKVEALEAFGADRSPEELRELRYWRVRLAGAVLIDSAKNPPGDIRFGAEVEVRGEDGKPRRFKLVGQDEAEGDEAALAWDSALALVSSVPGGDKVSWYDGEAQREAVVVSFRYA